MDTSPTPRHSVVNRDCESNLKRPSPDSMQEEDSKQRRIDQNDEAYATNTPLSLVFKSRDERNPLSKASPFLINKAIVGAGGQPNSIKKLRDGTVLVEAVDSKQSKQLLKTTSFFDKFQVVVQPHDTLNSSKGIVFSRELLECNLDANQFATPGHILTFNLPHPPETIKAGYLVLSVRPYFRNPQRCFRCQKFGHSSKVCQNKELCVQCGKGDHNEKTCNIEPFCVNCKGKHSAASRNCKIYLEEKEVIKIATVNKLSFVDARKQYRRRTAQLPKKDVSYAKAAASTTRDTPSCSHCSSLEAMVEALTQQMTNVISLLSANFNPIPQVQPKLLPAKTSDDPRLQSTRTKFLKTPNKKTNVSEKQKPQQQTPAERKALNDKLKQNIKSKIDNRSQGSPNTSTHSRFSSQSSVMEEDEIVDEQTL
ncbi:uncharacterized protein LOC124370199 [Homalodisca vitripennis]|uniref:uncharacterized protein LOC124370199 n=1 Tax=Homalodisca vitripennis TaxID=197043 RepID=UPI001EECD3AE|nr:uncharacterized protein LOC124370199 [Homalodisca vitripennis]